jgi:tRNA (guanine-N7-)-methyltransferase
MIPKYKSLHSLIDWRRGKRPLDLENTFGRKAQVEVEIGFGLGDYLIRLACQRPENDFIGIEPG